MSQSHSNMDQGCGNFELDPNFNFIIVGKGVEIMGNQYNQCLNNLRIAHCQSQSASVSNIVGTSSSPIKVLPSQWILDFLMLFWVFFENIK